MRFTNFVRTLLFGREVRRCSEEERVRMIQKTPHNGIQK